MMAVNESGFSGHPELLKELDAQVSKERTRLVEIKATLEQELAEREAYLRALGECFGVSSSALGRGSETRRLTDGGAPIDLRKVTYD